MSIEEEPGKIKKDTLKAVIKVQSEILTKEGTTVITGTGFLISKTNGKKIFLVTNKHVISDWNLADKDIKCYHKSIEIFCYKKESGFYAINIGLINKNKELLPKVKIHNNPSIDIALIDITSELETKKDLYITRFDQSYLVPFNKIYSGLKYGIGDNVFALGYPRGITSILNNFPIAKCIYIASLPGEEFAYDNRCKNRNGDIKKFTVSGKLIVADGLLVAGNSGGPIVIPTGVRFKYNDKEELQFSNNEKKNLILGIFSHIVDGSGINIIFSSDYINELLNDFI